MRRLARDGSGRAELQLLLRMSLGLVGVRGGRSGRSPGRAGRRGAAAGSARPRAGPRTSRGCRRRSAAAPPEGEGLSRGVVADRSAFPSLRLLNWGAALEMSEGGTGLIPGTSRPVPRAARPCPTGAGAPKLFPRCLGKAACAGSRQRGQTAELRPALGSPSEAAASVCGFRERFRPVCARLVEAGVQKRGIRSELW